MEQALSKSSNSNKNFVPLELVELFLSYRIPTSDNVTPLFQPRIRIYIAVNGKERLYGETEALKESLKPDFKTTFVVHYHFETHQPVRFEIFDLIADKWEVVANINTSLAEMMGTKDQTGVFRITGKNGKCGKLLVRCEKVKENNSTAFFEVSARKLSSKSNWFRAKIYYFALIKIDNFEELEIYRSEPIKKETNPKWNSFTLPLQMISDNTTNGNTKLRFDVHTKKYFGEKLSGQCDFTLEELLNENKREFVLCRPNKKKRYGILEISDFHLGQNLTFIDHLRDGMQLNIMFGIDYTIPKGISHNPVLSNVQNSLSEIQILQNESQLILNELCQIFLHYNHDKKAAVYGFGGKTSDSGLSTKDFIVSGNENNPYLTGINEVMEAYYTSMKTVASSDYGYFEPVLGKAIENAKRSKNQNVKEYTLLTVFLRNTMIDIEQTFQALAECDSLPISIIIFGLGSSNFERMRIFYREGFFIPKDGKRQRNCVQFVTKNDFNGDIKAMITDVLKEIPNQILSYMKLNAIPVGPLKQIDIDKVLATQKSLNVCDHEELPVLSLTSILQKQKSKSFSYLDGQGS